MDSLLAQISTLLAGLGQWGPIAGAGVVLLVMYLRKKFGPQPPPDVPTPGPSPATNPLKLAPSFPLIDRLLKHLGVVPANKAATLADVPHGTLVQLRNEIDGLIDAKADVHTAALSDLGIEPEPEAVEVGPKGK